MRGLKNARIKEGSSDLTILYLSFFPQNLWFSEIKISQAYM